MLPSTPALPCAWTVAALQKDTPQPSDADVRVVSFEAIKVFARTFSGFATEGMSAWQCSYL
jgi:hypothetical protein